MFSALSFAPSPTPTAPAAHLPSPAITSNPGQLFAFPTNRLGRLLLFAVGAWLATACTSESSPEQPATEASAPVTEDAPAEESSPNGGNDECRNMQDMWDALPKLETYKQFKRDETSCLPASGMLSYKFRTDGNEKGVLMTISLIDDQRLHDVTYTNLAKETHASTGNPNSGAHKATLGIGEIPSVIATEAETGSIGKYICLFKGHYYFEILVGLPDKSLAKPEDVEAFMKEYLQQIDPDKLK